MLGTFEATLTWLEIWSIEEPMPANLSVTYPVESVCPSLSALCILSLKNLTNAPPSSLDGRLIWARHWTIWGQPELEILRLLPRLLFFAPTCLW